MSEEAFEATEETIEETAPEVDEAVAEVPEEAAPAPAPAAPRGRALRRGDTGPEVAALQETLNAILDRPRVLVDGQFGASTERWCQKILAQLGYDDEVSAFDPAFFSQLV
jgi:peptidoglycan hydrolase-like protein with peptidoglycan-binding domain